MSRTIFFVWCILIQALALSSICAASAQTPSQTGQKLLTEMPGENCTIDDWMECWCVPLILPGDEPDLFTFIAEGLKEPQQVSVGNSAVFFLGTVGAELTTSALITAGNLSKLHSVATPQGERIFIIDEDDEIGFQIAPIKENFPKLIIKNDTEDGHSMQFFSFPSFEYYFRSINADIVANTFMSKALRNITKFKLVFVIPESFVAYNEFSMFNRYAKDAIHFVNEIFKFKNSFGLVVSRVQSHDFSGRYIEDSVVIARITQFLKIYKAALIEDLNLEKDENEREIILKKLAFVEEFLFQDENGNYSRIWFIRSPIECGRLSDMEVMQSARANITEMCRRLQPKFIDPLSGESAFNLNFQLETIIDLGFEVNQVVSKTLTNFKFWYQSSNETSMVKT